MKAGYEIILKLLERYFGKRGAKVVVCLILMTFGITHPEIQQKQGAALRQPLKTSFARLFGKFSVLLFRRALA